MRCHNVKEFTRMGKTVLCTCKYQAESDSRFCRWCMRQINRDVRTVFQWARRFA